MPCRHHPNNPTQIKLEISTREHEIQRMKADVEYFQNQAMIIRQAISYKEQKLEEIIRRLERIQLREAHND